MSGQSTDSDVASPQTAAHPSPTASQIMAALSDDAKVVMGGWFGIGLTEVTFALEKGRPTSRCQAAIDELVKAGVVWREPFGQRGFRLKPCHLGEPYGRWLMRNRTKARWPIMEDIRPKARAALAKHEVPA